MKTWQLFASVGAAWAVAVLVFGGRAPARVAPASPSGPAPSRELLWYPIAGNPELVPGRWYRACVELPWYVPSSLVTGPKVVDYATKRGFTNVRSWTSLPPGWQPSACDGDVYVEALYSGEPQVMDRPAALVGAWELLAVA